MKTCSALFLEKDHELTAGILPEVYFKSPSVKDFDFPWYEKAPSRQLSEVRAAWSPRFLYLHLWANDTFVAAKENRPKGLVTQDDCFSVFLQPPGTGYWVWEVNALGTLREYKVPGTPVDEASFDHKWKTKALWKTQKHPAGWVLELKIPFEKDLGLTPRPGESWKATFNRFDVDSRGLLSLSTWSQLSASDQGFHHPQGFGELRFL